MKYKCIITYFERPEDEIEIEDKYLCRYETETHMIDAEQVQFSLDTIKDGKVINGLRFIEKVNDAIVDNYGLLALVDALMVYKTEKIVLTVSLYNDAEDIQYNICEFEVTNLSSVLQRNRDQNYSAQFEREVELN